MNIGRASEQTGLPIKTIRYYEDIGLVVPMRQGNGYRDYRDHDLHQLTFLQRARGLGFTIEDCRVLLSLYADETRASADVKRLADARIEEIDRKICGLQSLRGALTALVEVCHGDHRPDCPILDDLAGERNA